MNIAQRITHNDFAGAMIGPAKVTPAKNYRKNETAGSVMADAHKRYLLSRQRNAKTQLVNNRWQRVPAAYSAVEFGFFLKNAWAFAKAKRSKELWTSGRDAGVAVSADYLASCRTDGMVKGD